jgi:hypothetical protein
MEKTNEPEEKAQSSSDANRVIEARFKKEREDWVSTVSDMSERLRDIYKLADLQTDLYSNRQIALEYSHTIMSHLSRVNAIFRERKVERFNHYTRFHDIRLEKDPKYDHIHADLNDILERRDLLQNHLDYLRETIRTIDNLIFGIKHRMALEEYRRGV